MNPDDSSEQPGPDDDVAQRLALLRTREMRVDVVQSVMHRIEAERPRGWLQPVVVAFLLVLGVGFLGTFLVAPNALQAAAGWLKTIVVREEPAPGQPGAPPAVLATAPPSGGPIRHVTLDEARRSVSFPVSPPQLIPSNFVLADVTVFQPNPAMPPSQVFLTYRRPGAAQPLVITYQAAGTASEVVAPPGATRDLMVGTYRAVYIDDAAAGLRPANGNGPPEQIGRLIVERPDVVLTATGDRRDGLDASALATILASIP